MTMARTLAPYHPRPGGLAWRLAQWLIDNRDEMLRPGDMGIRFGVDPYQVTGALAIPVAWGWFQRGLDSEGRVVYSAGPELPERLRLHIPTLRSPKATRAAARSTHPTQGAPAP